MTQTILLQQGRACQTDSVNVIQSISKFTTIFRIKISVETV